MRLLTLCVLLNSVSIVVIALAQIIHSSGPCS